MEKRGRPKTYVCGKCKKAPKHKTSGMCKSCVKEYNANRDKSNDKKHQEEFHRNNPGYMEKHYQENKEYKNAVIEKLYETIPPGIYGIYYNNELVYIGESIKPYTRKVRHFTKFTKIEHAYLNSAVSVALHKGEIQRENLTFKMLEFIDDTPTRKQREMCLIHQHKPLYNSDMYGKHTLNIH